MKLFLPSPQKTKCLLYYRDISILDAFAKFQEVATTFVMFSILSSVCPYFRLYVHPSVSMRHLDLLWTNFYAVLCWRVSLKFAEYLHVLLKSAKLSDTEHNNLSNFMTSL